MGWTAAACEALVSSGCGPRHLNQGSFFGQGPAPWPHSIHKPCGGGLGSLRFSGVDVLMEGLSSRRLQKPCFWQLSPVSVSNDYFATSNPHVERVASFSAQQLSLVGSILGEPRAGQRLSLRRPATLRPLRRNEWSVPG